MARGGVGGGLISSYGLSRTLQAGRGPLNRGRHGGTMPSSPGTRRPSLGVLLLSAWPSPSLPPLGFAAVRFPVLLPPRGHMAVWPGEAWHAHTLHSKSQPRPWALLAGCHGCGCGCDPAGVRQPHTCPHPNCAWAVGQYPGILLHPPWHPRHLQDDIQDLRLPREVPPVSSSFYLQPLLSAHLVDCSCTHLLNRYFIAQLLCARCCCRRRSEPNRQNPAYLPGAGTVGAAGGDTEFPFRCEIAFLCLGLPMLSPGKALPSWQSHPHPSKVPPTVPKSPGGSLRTGAWEGVLAVALLTRPDHTQKLHHPGGTSDMGRCTPPRDGLGPYLWS